MSPMIWSLLLGCTQTPQQLSRPNAIALSGDKLYVSDFHHQRIVVFGTDGEMLQTFGGQGLGRNQFWEIWGLLADPETGDIHVLNDRPTSSTEIARVREVKTFRDGREIASVPLVLENGSAPEWCEGISRDDNGNWVVAAVNSRALVRFAPNGSFQEQRMAPQNADAYLSPSAVHQEHGGLWVIEQFAHRIRHLDADHNQTLAFGTEGGADGEIRFPKALDVCTDEWMVVADFGNHRIQRFDLAGTFIDGFEPEPVTELAPVQLMDVAVDANCERLYLVDSKGDRVLVTDVHGNLIDELSMW